MNNESNYQQKCTSSDELRDRIARAHFAKSAETAALQIGLEEPIKWEDLKDLDRSNCRASAQAIIDDLGLEVVDVPGGISDYSPFTGKPVVQPDRWYVEGERVFIRGKHE